MRASGINVASCHAILAALAARGYVRRDPEQKTFSLGPVLVAAGEAALRSQPMLARARDVALDLARDLAVPVLLTAAVDDEMVGIFSLPDPSGHRPKLATGERRPMVPPLGAPFVAWGGEEAIAAWLVRGGHAGEAGFAADQRRALGLIRARGFQVLLRNPDSPRLAPEAGAGYKDRMIGQVDALGLVLLPETIAPDAHYDVILIAAPVFDRSGACAYNLCLGEFASRLSGSAMLAHAERLIAASLAIMQAERG